MEKQSETVTVAVAWYNLKDWERWQEIGVGMSYAQWLIDAELVCDPYAGWAAA